jgi:hypothetical protein
MNSVWEPTLTRQQYQSLLRELAELPSPLMLREGLQLMEVIRVNAESPKHHVFGDVTDRGMRFGVEFAPSGLVLSHCTCHAMPYCRHIVAFFFSIASACGYRIAEDLQRSPQEINERPDQKGSDDRPDQEGSDDRSAAASWPVRAAQLVARYVPRIGDVQLAHYKRYRQAAENAYAELIPPALRPLALLHATVVFLQVAEHRKEKLPSSYYWGGLHTFQELREACEAVMYEASRETDHVQAAADDGEVRLALIETLREAAFEDRNAGPKRPLVDWPGVYRFIWRHALPVRRWVEEEVEWIRSERQHKPSARRPAYHAERLTEALVHHSFLLGDAEASVAYLEKVPTSHWPSLLQPYFDLYQQTDPERLYWWLGRIGQMQSAERELTGHNGLSRWMAERWSQLLKASGSREKPWAEEALEQVEALLPMSLYVYEELLLESEAYERWADLQMVLGADAGELDPRDRKRIEKAQPELLLPIYHTSIERLVGYRNREAYQAAASQLAYLARLYKRLKRQEEWAAFMRRFTAKYSRYSSLKSEMKRRKLS